MKQLTVEEIDNIIQQHIALAGTTTAKVTSTMIAEAIYNALPCVRGSLPSEIYLTYDRSDGEVACAFVDKEECEREAMECGCGMQTVRLVGKQ
jgi:hypothetical protein